MPKAQLFILGASMESILVYLDYLGIVSFSVTGAIAARRKNLDLFGVLLISYITAVGGGSVRDMLLGNSPVFWMGNPIYLYLITVSSLLAQMSYTKLEKIDNILKHIDAIGLATFTIVGIRVAEKTGIHFSASILMGVMSAVFGGILRDVLCNKIPLILQKEIYATASLLGGVLFFTLKHFGIEAEALYIISIAFIASFRVVAIYFNLSLPNIPRL